MIRLTRIGTVNSDFTEQADPFVMRRHESRITVDEKYREGLFRLEDSAYVMVVFGFHQADGFDLKGPIYSGEIKGVFASRSPRRPSPLGVSTVRLLSMADGVLAVRGLDALDGSPVFDIKPHAPVFDSGAEGWNGTADAGALDTGPETHPAYADPRFKMLRLVQSRDLAGCLLAAGTLHGHYCPGLALGVYASVAAMNRSRESFSDGLENLLAIVEVNSCFADGVQAVTGCTLGNNSLVYRDLGKTAFTLLRRGSPRGIRVSVKTDFGALLNETYPEFSTLFEKVIKKRAGSTEDMTAFKVKGREASFGLLSLPAERLFDIREVETEPPPFAPIVESLVCARCGEQVMKTKSVTAGADTLCRACAGAAVPCVTGAGIG
ncbi:MAG TPA: hypothetical protein ENN69_00120 [Spirochaetia bacterium]|nr:hypothetical protein [Spirochaetia bacterium]